MNLISRLYWRYLKSPVEQGRHIGVRIGKYCSIGRGNWGSEPYLITIGNNVCIAPGVCFHNHGGASVARRLYPNFDVFGKIWIQDWAYIGSGCHIMPGVTIGEGALIGAGSIVCKSVPKNEVWAGVPARRICTVDEYIKKKPAL